MLRYFFVVDINSNEILVDKPKKSKGKYKTPVRQALQKIKPGSMAEDERGKKNLEDGEVILYQKMNSKVLMGAIVHNCKKDSDVYRLFNDFNEEIKNSKKPLKGSKELETWIKTQSDVLNRGDRSNSAARINNRLEQANSKIEARITQEMKKFEELDSLEQEIIQMEEVSKDMSSNAVVLHREAYLYNKKLELMIWGAVALLSVIIGVWLLEVVV